MRILHAFNRHRAGGGSDNAWDATIALSQRLGIETEIFERDSRDIGPGFVGKFSATVAGAYSREAIRAFRDTLDRVHPDAVHAHELYPLISHWIFRECHRAGVPVIFTCYDYRLTCPIATHYHHEKICLDCLERSELAAIRNNCRDNLAETAAYALRNAVSRRFGLARNYVTRFIVLTEFSEAWLSEKLGVESERIDVIPCVIPIPPTSADPAEGAYAAYAGRFVPEKGVELLIEAARRTGIPLKLAGGESSHPAIREGDDVECVVTHTRDELAAFYRGARMLVVPSTWYETFGIVAAESLSHGVPVVASRIGALETTVRGGITGLHVEPGNIDDLCKAMERLWADADLCRTLGAAGRQDVQRRFSESTHGEALMKTYETAIAM